MRSIVIPPPVQRLLAVPGMEFIARLAIASPFVVSGVSKVVDFQGAAGEMIRSGLHPAGVFATAVIITQIGGSFLFLMRRFCWLGAGILAVFTILATLLAHRFWEFAGVDRIHEMTTFFEHIAIAGGLAVAAMLVNGRSEIR